jgi:hypothetical protein
MVDWGVKSNIASSIVAGSGGLHHARYLFKEKTDFEMKNVSESGDVEVSELYQPFPIKNYSIYQSWLKSNKTKIMFMHATAICPRDDIAVGQIENDLTWNDSQLCYGTFDNRRPGILKDVENENLNIVVTGHSHRNMIMEVDYRHENQVRVLGAGERYGTIKHLAKKHSNGNIKRRPYA